jgi:hypothetical protein
MPEFSAIAREWATKVQEAILRANAKKLTLWQVARSQILNPKSKI